jgi:hypothetical protein
VKLDASLFLQVADDSEEVAGLRIAARSEHTDEAIRLRAGRRQASRSLPDHPDKRIDKLLPWNWKASQQAIAEAA